MFTRMLTYIVALIFRGIKSIFELISYKTNGIGTVAVIVKYIKTNCYYKHEWQTTPSEISYKYLLNFKDLRGQIHEFEYDSSCEEDIGKKYKIFFNPKSGKSVISEDLFAEVQIALLALLFLIAFIIICAILFALF